MEKKELKIDIPEGYEIDKENSTFEHIVFKKKDIATNYEDVALALFKNRDIYYITFRGNVACTHISNETYCADPNNCVNKKQVEGLLALNKLWNVAKYLKDEPKDLEDGKYYLYIWKGTICVGYNLNRLSCPMFNSEQAAKKAIEILGEETIKKAIEPFWEE